MRKVILLLVAAMFAIGVVSAKPDGTLNSGYKVGDKARDFKLKNIDGKMVSLADYSKAKGFIVIFTCNHCPYAKAYEDRIVALNKKYEPQGYPVVAINPNDPAIEPEDSFTEMQKRAKDKGFNFAYLVDDTQEIAHTYGAAHTPHIFILKKQGSDNIVSYIGAIDDNSGEPSKVKTKYAENALIELIENKPVTTASTKAIGCSIKWKK